MVAGVSLSMYAGRLPVPFATLQAAINNVQAMNLFYNRVCYDMLVEQNY